MYVLILISISVVCVSTADIDHSTSDELDQLFERKFAEKERVFVEIERKIDKTLQELNEREHMFEETLRTFKAREQKLSEREREFEKRVETLEAACVNGFENNNFTKRAIATVPPSTPVAFLACVSPPDLTGLGKGQTIIFDQVETNLGGGYHPNLGVFFAPLKGVYVFHVSALVTPGHAISLTLVKDGSAKHWMYPDSSSITDITSSTGTWILELDQYSEVSVKTIYGGDLHGFCYSSFSGFLLRELE